jgi:hypothetical protein
LTSSEVFGWREIDVPSWYADTNNPFTIMEGKRGVEKTFEREAETSIAHGTYDEEHILEKFGYIVGCDVCPDNGLYINERWSHIAASIDGLGRPWDYDCGPKDPETHYDEAPDVHEKMCQDRTLAPYLRDYIDSAGVEFLTESKKSTSVKFQKMTPEYYVPQVQTQLAILELDYAIIMADTFKRGDTQKWRFFWDFRAYVIERDRSWDLILDEENENFKTALDLL